MSTQDRFGPIDLVVVEFPEGKVGTDGFTRLLDLVDRGVIRILDLEFVANDDGTARQVPISDIEVDVRAFDGAFAGLLDRDDLDAIAAELPTGSLAAAVVYEELSMLDVLNSWETAGARIIADIPVGVDELAAALDATAIAEGVTK
ncbi:DUF6325 family protein [Rhodococcus sp. NPDC003322]